MIHFFQALRSKRANGQLRDTDLSPRALAEFYQGDVQRFLTDTIVFMQEFRNDISYLREFGEPAAVGVLTTDWHQPDTHETSTAA